MTNRRSRREFLGMTGAGIAGVVGAPLLGAAADAAGTRGQAAAVRAQDADLVVHNAKVYTVDTRAPRAEAFAVKNGKFMAVGRR
jgi:hypothetical protein